MFTTIAGVKIQYQRMGDGPVLVLLHGWGCDWQIWSPIISQLSSQFTLIIPDLPAFGQSEAAKSVWNSEDYATWLDKFLQQVIPDQEYVILGHSFGGKIAALYASDKQKTSTRFLTGLVLVSASGLPDALPPSKQLQKSLLRLIPTALKQLIPTQLKTELFAVTQTSTDYVSSNQAQRQIMQRIVSENIAHALPHIHVPTLLIWGKHDPDTPLHQGQQFQRAIPHATLRVMNTGHFPFIDQPAAFMASLEQFLNHE